MTGCNDFRDRWLERALSEEQREPLRREAHPESCEPCRTWLRSTDAQVRALLAMRPVALPDELLGAVEVSLARPALEHALRSLPALEAPAELDARVESTVARIADEATVSGPQHAAASVRALDLQPVPPVLERLLDEELSAPQRHLVERFVGNLEPVPAPDRLAVLVDRGLRHSWRRPVLRTVAAVLAAAVLLWVLVPRSVEPRMRIVVVDDVRALDPVARGMAEGLRGGAWTAEVPR